MSRPCCVVINVHFKIGPKGGLAGRLMEQTPCRLKLASLSNVERLHLILIPNLIVDIHILCYAKPNTPLTLTCEQQVKIPIHRNSQSFMHALFYSFSLPTFANLSRSGTEATKWRSGYRPKLAKLNSQAWSFTGACMQSLESRGLCAALSQPKPYTRGSQL